MTDPELYHTTFGPTYQNKIEKTIDFKVGDIVLERTGNGDLDARSLGRESSPLGVMQGKVIFRERRCF